jgi:hypothetical protein
VYYKDDWDSAKARFRAFWNREIVDRCCLAVAAPRKGARRRSPDEPPRTEAELVRHWLDPEDNLRRMIARFEQTYYGGEAYPATTMCLGASAMAAFYGSRVEYRPETAWFHPVIKDLETFAWSFDPETAPLYRATFDNTRYFARECRGRYLVGLPELGSATDDLALLRGMEPLVYDMMDRPAAVKRGIDALVDTWRRAHQELYEIALPANDGGCPIPWMQTWAPGPHYQMSCDFSAVLSPQMFRDFIVPELQGYLKVNAYSVYHWDGPDALKHLDALLQMDDLRAIQWTAGAGQQPAASPRWMPYYQRIQETGKCLILPFAEIGEVETILRGLSSRGLLLATWAPSEDDARDLLRRAGAWTHA